MLVIDTLRLTKADGPRSWGPIGDPVPLASVATVEPPSEMVITPWIGLLMFTPPRTPGALFLNTKPVAPVNLIALYFGNAAM